MVRLVIGRQGESGLGFDLPEVLKALGPRVLASAWAIDGLHYVSTDERNVSGFQAEEGVRIPGAKLLSGISNLLQVLDGEFRAFEASREPWVIVRAIDSSWWEVESDDSVALSAIRERFRNVDEQS
ncbi:MAG TPA: hypothetical protein VLE22_12680 [Bryobacteraceae bacterium]|nr:hypothetical protein [Bryobacteraceae bacterium]